MFPSSKEVFLHNFRQFLENWFFDGNSTGADLTKIVKFCTVSKCTKEIFFGLTICSPHQKNCLFTIWGNFLKIDFLMEIQQARTLKNSDILYCFELYQGNSFWLNYMFPSSKEVFQSNLREILENWFFDRNSTGADLTKIVKILYYL